MLIVLTHHEVLSKTGNEIKNLLSKSEVLDNLGRAPDSSIVKSVSVGSAMLSDLKTGTSDRFYWKGFRFICYFTYRCCKPAGKLD